MIWAESGAGKTSRLGDAAEYYFDLTGKPARLVSTDPGGWGAIESLIVDGTIVPFRVVKHREHLMQDLNKLTQGFWPVDPSNPLSPFEEKPDLSNVSVLLFDGISSMCEMLSEYHLHAVKMEGAGANRTVVGTNVKIAGLPRDNFIEDAEYNRRILSQTDYGEIQRTARELLSNTSFLPIPTIWTALPCKSEDDNDRPVHGPKFFGKALTGNCGNLFGNMLHLYNTQVKVKEDGKEVVKEVPMMYLRTHSAPGDQMKVPMPAKVRAPRTLHHKIPLYMAPDLKLLYKELDKLRDEEVAMRAAARQATPATVGGVQ